jgi:hypothetical protein
VSDNTIPTAMKHHGPEGRCEVCKDCNFAISEIAERAEKAEAKLARVIASLRPDYFVGELDSRWKKIRIADLDAALAEPEKVTP